MLGKGQKSMSEELIQRNLVNAPEKIGTWNFYNIGATTLKALKGAKIIPDRDYEEYECKKPDALIVKKPQVLAAIEYKQPKELKTKKQIESAIAQEIGTAVALGAKIYIVTDGKKTFWINPLTGNEIKTEDGNTVSLQFDKNNVECIKFINKAVASINETNDTLLVSAVVDPLPLAQQVWQDLWSVSGATPENCLYTFVEIFIFKYLSDLGVLKGIYSFSNLLAQYSANSENEVIEFYASTVRVKIKELFPMNLKDKTTIINGTIFVSKDDRAVAGYATVFKKILNRFNDFGTLENIDYDFKSKLFETFLKESISKKNWGQFFTPLKVVRAIVSMADIVPGIKICDPACGVGKFLLEPILHDLHKYFKVEDGTLKPQITLSGFDKGFDKDEQKTIILAKANMLIYLSGLIKENADLTKQFAELFNDTFLLQTNSILGTLARPIKDEYDLILTNPPYVMSGSSNLKEEIAKQEDLKQYYSISAMGIEGLFMEWIVRALKPGGKAFIVVPDGIMNRSNDKRLREFILDECILDAVISLPLNTFFTTNKKTYIMALTKKVPVLFDGIPIKERQDTPVFTYLCSEIGETRDNYRFDIEQNDLDNATTLYNMFKGVRGVLPIEDKRCKIVSVDEFINGTHWSVERWWTREEKVELGLEDDEESISIEDFISMITDTASTLSEFEEPLRELVKKKFEMTNSRTVSLADQSLFEISIGNRILKKDFVESAGTIPAYSANVFKPFAYVEKSNIDDFSFPCVIWGIDGNFEFNVINSGEKFATTDHCGKITIKNSQLNPYYLAFMLEQTKHVYGFDRGLRASLTNMRKVEISIPVNASGNFDISAQESIAEQYMCVNELRREIKEKHKKLSDCTIIVPNSLKSYKTMTVSVGNVFTVERGSGKYTKTYAQNHEGQYPLYSGNTVKEFAHINSYDYDMPCISWAIDGLAGYIMCHRFPFSATNHRGVLLPNNNNLDIEYAKFILEPKFRELKKGRLGDRGQNEYTSLPPFMIMDVEFEIPINNNGDFDLMAQREIAKKYTATDHYKHEILKNLDGLLDQKISY